MMWWVLHLQSAEWQSGSGRAPQALGEVLSSCRSLPLQASVLLHYCPPLPSVCAGGQFFAVGPLQPVLGISYPVPSCPSLMLHSLHLLEEVLHLSTLSEGRFTACPCPRRKGRELPAAPGLHCSLWLGGSISHCQSKWCRPLNWCCSSVHSVMDAHRYCLEGQVKWVPLSCADGHQLVPSCWVMWTWSLCSWQIECPFSKEVVLPAHLPVQTVTPCLGWCTVLFAANKVVM